MGMVTDNLALAYEAALANGGVGTVLNRPLTTTFGDLSGLGNNGTLKNFAGGGRFPLRSKGMRT